MNGVDREIHALIKFEVHGNVACILNGKLDISVLIDRTLTKLKDCLGDDNFRDRRFPLQGHTYSFIVFNFDHRGVLKLILKRFFILIMDCIKVTQGYNLI